jgi:hypothetical protein
VVLDEHGEEEEDSDVADGMADFLLDSDDEGTSVPAAFGEMD